jgi:DNA polymerase-3 subunit gamma/tau
MHNLSKQAQESLLTIIETPPSGVIFILCTTMPEKVITTLRTRCLHFALSPPIEEEKTQLITRVAEAEERPIPTKVEMAQLLSYSSVRELLAALEMLFLTGSCGVVVENSDKTEPAFYQIARALVSSRPLSDTTLAALLKECRKDVLSSQAGIIEYLHSCMLARIAKGQGAWDIINAIDVLAADKNPLPGVFSAAIIKLMYPSRKTPKKEIQF